MLVGRHCINIADIVFRIRIEIMFSFIELDEDDSLLSSTLCNIYLADGKGKEREL